MGFNAWTNLYKKQASRLVNGLVNDTPLGEYRLLIESDWNPIDFDFEGSGTAEVLSENTARFLHVEPVEER